MSRRRSLSLSGALSGALVASALIAGWLAAGPVAAGWLITHDGARVATLGSWKVARNQVVFTAPNGTLSTLRLADIDLAASHEATTAVAAEPAEAAAPAAKPQPIAVITDADIPRGRRSLPATASAPGDTETSPADDGEEAVESDCLEVTWWRAAEEDANVIVRGTLRNGGPTMATAIVLEVAVESASRPGEWLAATAFLDDELLAPGLTTTFRAVFPSDASPREPRFTVRCRHVALGYGGPTPGPEDDLGGELGGGDGGDA